MNYAWMQPPKNFGQWKSRGVDCIVLPSLANNITLDAWCKAARDAKLVYVLGADAPAANFADPACVGCLLLPDEPNGGIPTDPNYVSPGKMLDASVVARAKTTKPLWISLAGTQLQYQKDPEVAAFCACADAINFDLYPYNFGLGIAGVATMFGLIDRLHSLSGGKKIICDIESADFGIPSGIITPSVPGERYRPPSAGEFTDMTLGTRVHQAETLFFSHASGPPWKDWDATPLDISGAMTALCRRN
jgi:hypothetical protein